MKKLAPEERIRARLRELAEQAGEARRELQQFIDQRRLGERDTAPERMRPPRKNMRPPRKKR